MKAYRSSPIDTIEIDRNKLRFVGIGPKLLSDDSKIWPRDELDPEKEVGKIFYSEITRLVRDDKYKQAFDRAKKLVLHVIDALKNCNVHQLFNQVCRLDPPYFERASFDVLQALDAYTRVKDVICLIDRCLMSVNRYNKKFNTKCLIKHLFGSYKNRDIFKNNIRWLVVGNSKFRRQTVGSFMSCGDIHMNIDEIVWLNGLPEEVRYPVFCGLIHALVRFVRELIRRYFYVTVSNPHSFMLIYFRYDLWQKIQHLQIQRMLITDQAILHKFSLEGVRIEENSSAKIKFHLKMDGLRMICTRLRDTNSRMYLYLIEAVLQFVLSKTENFKWFRLEQLLLGLKDLKKIAQERNGSKLYFVKADIKDCFQSVDQEKLRTIINNCLSSHFEEGILRFVQLECFTKKIKPRRTIKLWTLDAESVKASDEYLNVEVNCAKEMSIESFNDIYLCPHILSPVLRESRTSKFAYNLIKGIKQGCSFSPLLCSIYLQAALNKYLADLYASDDCKIYRHVDDLLFVSTDIDKSHKFMHKILKGFQDFNLRANLHKVECNFEFQGVDNKLWKDRKYITFFRRRIAVDNTLNCSYAYGYKSVTLEQTFIISPQMDEYQIKRSIRKLSKLELIHLDCGLNKFDQIVLNIFEHALLTAHRAATLMICSFKFKRRQQQNRLLVLKLINIVSKRLNNIINYGSEKGLIENSLTELEVRLIVVDAFLTTWERKKLTHRKVELNAIQRFRNRLFWIYIRQEDDVDTSLLRTGVPLQTKLIELRNNFPSSNFAREVLLP